MGDSFANIEFEHVQLQLDAQDSCVVVQDGELLRR